MIFEKLRNEDFGKLVRLEQQYKMAIGEEQLHTAQMMRLERAIQDGQIEFYTAKADDELIAMCSVSITFSTFLCQKSAIFEDFYIETEYRHQGIARELVNYVFDDMRSRGIASIWVGCSDAHVEMYKRLGFSIPLGNLLTCNM